MPGLLGLVCEGGGRKGRPYEPELSHDILLRMRAILFGATGMVGQGVLRELLLDLDVDRVLIVSRRPAGVPNPKVLEILHTNFYDFSSIEKELSGYDACFFCLGVSSLGKTEADYKLLTYDLTLAAATTLARLNPKMAFLYVSGVGTDSTEHGRVMWARVKGATENALLTLFPNAVMIRPGYIQPMHGVSSPSQWTRRGYAVFGVLYPLLRALFPKSVTNTEELGRAMIHAARGGAGTKRILEPADLIGLGVPRRPAS
jgi:uncharacterized protein YbjT (DUF2867 family)